MDHVTVFRAHHSQMLSTAFHITGSRHDAEDVVQDAWSAWSRTELASIREPRTFLSVLVARLAINSVRKNARRREAYLGPWVPDPVVDDGSPEWAALHREGLGQALDFVLSTLSAEQAAAYVLRKVVDVDYEAIALALDRTPAAARKLVSRAQLAVSAALCSSGPDQAARSSRALERLVEAVLSGDVQSIVGVLAPDATLYSDGGGEVTSALRPIEGAERIARFLLGLASMGDLRIVPATINGSAGILIGQEGIITTTVTVHAGDAGVRMLCFVRHPEKLAILNQRGLLER